MGNPTHSLLAVPSTSNRNQEPNLVNETQEYIVRVQSNRAYTYGLGQVIVPGVALFAAGRYDLTEEQLAKEIAKLPKVKR